MVELAHFDAAAQFAAHAAQLDDPWQRRRNTPRFRRDCHVFGWPVVAISNDEPVLAAFDEALPLYSEAVALEKRPFFLQFTRYQPQHDPGPAPDDLPRLVQDIGEGTWLIVQAGQWGVAHVDLAQGQATIALTPSLAARPDLVALCLLNKVLLNLLIAHGFAMLHASCLHRNGRALLLLAPHNTGKSTTALRLALGGYQLLSDSMIFIAPGNNPPQLLGFPVRRIKLRGDMVSHFPQVHHLLRPEQVRDETKFTVDLHQIDPALVHSAALVPAQIDLCLLQRHDQTATTLHPATLAEVMAAVLDNSLFYDTTAVWQRNLTTIYHALRHARPYRLCLGRDEAGILTAVNTLT